ncbi:hypothetical protein JXA48_04375 [Candidatus Woesearchaeota archaeon]|nr:hypothetical protein [Candidatus Woesearchaeota archaeon]
MKLTETLFIGQTAYLQGMNVFDIGTNRAHINLGLMGSQISNLATQINSISKETKQLVIPGYVLELLEENDDELLDSLKLLVKTNNIKLLSVPYYNSSLSLMSKEELSTQLNLQEKITQRIFNKKSDGFFCAEGILPPSVETVLNKNYSKVFYPKDSAITLKSPTYKLIQTDVMSLGEEKVGSLSMADSKMEGHLINELRNIYPHIVNMGDVDTLTSWRFMTQPSMILRAGVSNFSGDAYEHYMQMMNTLNDIAHKIRNVELAKKGLFQEKPIISPSPSLLLAN